MDFPYSLSTIVLFGLAAASLWKLAVADRITRSLRYGFVHLSRRLQTHRGIGLIAYHIEYLVGCALCAPMWAAIGLWWFAVRDHYYWAQAIVFVLAVRFVAYGLLRYLQETSTRDWPKPLEWPPAPRKSQVEGD